MHHHADYLPTTYNKVSVKQKLNICQAYNSTTGYQYNIYPYINQFKRFHILCFVVSEKNESTLSNKSRGYRP
ncbi:hypothetical protein CAP36_10800 [Chitinophagaceae bacterium IBVUCB2]|nr:hypothetical protein CAP36_10800 [Chitinophagaceae bacterium IBVUCB2]